MKKIWELDFYSRPNFFKHNKKLWEVLICETPMYSNKSFNDCFKFSQLCPSSTVNSIWLRQAIEKAMKKAGESPDLIRFFRFQMQNMIIKACKDAEIEAIPSRRTFALNYWIDKREKQFKLVKNRINNTVSTINRTDTDSQMVSLPDTLKDNQFSKYFCVDLKVSDFNHIDEWDIGFGENYAISPYGLSSHTIIPGLVFFSPRALPIAAWLSGFEVVSLRFDKKNSSTLYLETGLNDKSVLINLNDIRLIQEAKNFERKKENSKGIHFLAIQPSPDVELFSGFWLLKDELISRI